MEKIGIKELAKELGFSVSTVSKALNNSPEISKKTKEHIVAYAQKRGYRKNLYAMGLRKNQTKTIALVIPNMLDYFYAQVLKGAENFCSAKGYKIITFISNESYEKEKEIFKMLSFGIVDGFIFSIARGTYAQNDFRHLEDVKSRAIPILMFERISNVIDCEKIINNIFEIAIEAVEHLYRTSFRNIGFIATDFEITPSKELFRGYKEGLKKMKSPVREDLIVTGSKIYYKKNKTFINPIFRNTKIDSVIATTESAAITAMEIAQKKGHKIPKEFSAIGLTNGILSRHAFPKLTSISQHGELMGKAAAQTIIETIEKHSPHQQSVQIINASLVFRESTMNLKK